MKASWFKKQGYRKADHQGMAVLLWKPFTDVAEWGVADAVLVDGRNLQVGPLLSDLRSPDAASRPSATTPWSPHGNACLAQPDLLGGEPVGVLLVGVHHDPQLRLRPPP